MAKKAEIFAGKQHTPDSEDPDTVNHLTWYEATGFTRPFPGEKTVRPRAISTTRLPPRLTTTTNTPVRSNNPLPDDGERVFT